MRDEIKSRDEGGGMKDEIKKLMLAVNFPTHPSSLILLPSALIL
ncbi:MAG: hypothetical protein ACR2LM_16700 [Pyrinomonadaceae bacterium]